MKYRFYLIISTVFILMNSCSNDEKQITDNETPIVVTIHQVSKDTIGGTQFTASGKFVAENSTNVSTRMMGYITKMHVDVGQSVGKGQLLVSINNTDLKAKEGQINAQISQAQTNYNIAKKDYDRFKNLFDNQSASQKELDDMTARMQMAKAGLDAANQMKRELQSQYSYTNVTSPISGVVTQTFAKTGDLANPGMPLLSIESPSSIQAQVLVSESNITQIQKGMPVKVILKNNGEEINGTVGEVSLSSTNTGGQYMVKVDVPYEKSLLPGMYVNVVFPVESQSGVTENSSAVLVPQSALVHQGQLTGIYTVSNEGTALLRWVKTGKTMGDNVEILSGLNSNESYITSAQGKLYNGVKVSGK